MDYELARRKLLEGFTGLSLLPALPSWGKTTMDDDHFRPFDGPARLAPIMPAEYDDDVRAFLAQVEGPGGRKAGSSLNVILTLAHNPELAKRYFNFGVYILRFSSLDPRLREITTLRTAWLYDSEYEWTKHVATALRVGVTAAEIEAVKKGPDDGGWGQLERDLLSAVDQLIRKNRIEDATWAGIARHLDKKQQLDFLFSVTSYAMLAMVINSLRIPLEDE